MRDVEGRPVTTDTHDTGRARPSSGAEPTPRSRPRPSGHRRVKPEVYRRRRRRLAIVALVLLALLVAAVGWYESQTGGSGGPTVVVSVTPGSSMGTITATLVRQQVVDSSLAFQVYLTLHGSPTVEPGNYLLHRHESFSDVRAILAAGPNVSSVTVLPGFTIGEVATQVGQIAGHDPSHFLALADSGTVRSPYEPAGTTNLDGLVGTGSYLVLPGESDQTLLTDMIDRFDTLADAVGLSSGASALGVTPYQAITVASIVQKEGVYQENLGKVARVIYNRLAHGTPLQMDSTVLYSWAQRRWPGDVGGPGRSTPRTTPTCTPGSPPRRSASRDKASLQAALAPTPGSWLYFVVVSKDGTEAFSTTYAGQQANERLAQSRGLG